MIDARYSACPIAQSVFYSNGVIASKARQSPYANRYVLNVGVGNARDLGVGPALPTMIVDGDQFKYGIWIAQVNDITFTTIPVPVIEAAIDIDPDTLNLQSEGKWITCYIELPEGYDVSDIDSSTILLESVIPGESHPTEIGDYDDDRITDLMVKFDRQDVIDYLHFIAVEDNEEVELIVSGELTNGTEFEGTDTIRVIDKGGKK